MSQQHCFVLGMPETFATPTHAAIKQDSCAQTLRASFGKVLTAMTLAFTSSAPKSPLPLSSPGKEAGTGSSRNGASGARCAGSPPHSAGGTVQSLPPARAFRGCQEQAEMKRYGAAAALLLLVRPARVYDEDMVQHACRQHARSARGW